VPVAYRALLPLAKDPRTVLRARMRELVQVRIRKGYRRLQVLLRREGWRIGKNLAYRLYREESLQLRSKRPPRRKMVVARLGRYVPKRTNQAWSMDLLADQLANGTRFRTRTNVDVFTREALAIEVGRKLRGKDVVGVCNRVVAQRGTPIRIFVDYGSEFSGRLLDLWAYHHKSQIDFSRPGKPTDNCFIETFATIESWQVEYNESRRHQALSASGSRFVRDHIKTRTAKLTGIRRAL
jgi:putative transposase